MSLRIFLYIVCTLLLSPAPAQIVIGGLVADSEHKAPLPFVNIGIKNKNIGTSSQANGTFSISVPRQYENDTLTFSLVGYQWIHVPIQQIMASGQTVFQLKLKINELKEVSIKSNALTEKKFGIKKEHALVHFVDASTNQNDIFEIAQLIKLPKTLSKITSVNLLISESRKDSALFRINFYRYDGDRPSERIIEKSLIQTKKIDQGWLTFDLSENNIYLNGNVVVAIEFIPRHHKAGPVGYEVKLGGTAKSFVRTSSQGAWTQPPHHYKMHVTALVENAGSAKHPEEETDEDAETTPTTGLYSTSVRDSFFIFVKLPESYRSKKEKHFNTVYLLDGNAYFDAIADEIKKQKQELILVGIGYKNAYLMDSLRARDYTFPEAGSQEGLKISGGAKKFLDFITGELIPSIDRTYRTDTSGRMLMGHSLGGFFTLFAMQQLSTGNHQPFKHYVSASPSVEYGNQYLSRELQNTAFGSRPQSLIITAGEAEMKEEPAYKESYEYFVRSINRKGYKGLTVVSEVFPGYGHMDTAIPTFIKGLHRAAMNN